MSTTPQANPTADDLAREQYYAIIAATTLPPATYKGRSRGKTKDSSWRTNVALWEAYPELPVAPLAAGNKAGADAWLRIETIVVQKMFEEKPGDQSANWDPSKPTWPLPTPPATWSSGSSYGARRPWKKELPQTRKHTGIDLKAAPGTPVLAPFSGTIVARNSGWEYNAKTGKGVKSLIMQTDNGLTILLGGIKPDSAIVQDGQKVQAGQKLAEVGRYPLGDSMLHVTIYQGLLSEKEVNARKSWPSSQPPPANLIDPSSFLGQAANNPKYETVGFVQQGDGPGLVPNDVEGGEIFEGVEDVVPFVSASDGRTGTKPCVGKECVKADAVAWFNALNSYRSAADPLHAYASKLSSDSPALIAGVWAAGNVLKDASYAIAPDALPATNWGDATSEYLNLAYAVREAIDTLTAFVASASAPGSEQAPDAPKGGQPNLPPATPPAIPPKNPPAKPSSGGGSLGLVAGLGAAAVVAGVAIYLATRKSSRAAALLLLSTLMACGPMPPSNASSSSSGEDSEGQGSTSASPTPTSSAPEPTSTTGTTTDVPALSTTSGVLDIPPTTPDLPSASSSTSAPADPDGCSCNSNADCLVGTCSTFGLCAVECDPGCPVACQLGEPGMCDPPCDVPCPTICSVEGLCTVCIPPPTSTSGEPAPQPMTEPTSG